MRRRVLWSGGFDSTFLVLHSLRQRRPIEAVYLQQFDDWQKQIRERRAIERVLREVPAELRRYLTIGQEARLEDFWSRYSDIDPELQALDWTSPQNGYLAAVAEAVKGAACGLVADDSTGQQPNVLEAMKRYGLRYPLLYWKKADLLPIAAQEGFLDLLSLTWSCETHEVTEAGCGTCLVCRRRLVPVL